MRPLAGAVFAEAAHKLRTEHSWQVEELQAKYDMLLRLHNAADKQSSNQAPSSAAAHRAEQARGRCACHSVHAFVLVATTRAAFEKQIKNQQISEAMQLARTCVAAPTCSSVPEHSHQEICSFEVHHW